MILNVAKCLKKKKILPGKMKSISTNKIKKEQSRELIDSPSGIFFAPSEIELGEYKTQIGVNLFR